MKDEKAQLCVHEPLARVTLVLDLVKGPQMPLAVALSAPKRVVIASIGRLDPPRAVRSTLGCDPSVFHLDVFAGSSMGASRSCLIHWRRSCWDMAVRDVVACSGWTRRVDVCRVTISRYRVIVRPLIWRIKVSKWVH